MVDRTETERMRFLIEERKLTPSRARLRQVAAGHGYVALVVLPVAENLILRMLEVWERTRLPVLVDVLDGSSPSSVELQSAAKGAG